MIDCLETVFSIGSERGPCSVDVFADIYLPCGVCHNACMYIYIYIVVEHRNVQKFWSFLLFFIGLKCHSYALSLFLYIYIYVYDVCVYWAVSGESVV